MKAFVVADASVTKSKEIEDALTKLRKARGSHQFYRGELCTDEAVTKIIKMFVLLVNDLPWLLQPTLKPDKFEAVLSGIIRLWEGVFGTASQHGNRQRILTRGMIRQVMYEVAIVTGFLAAKSSSPKELLESHWHSPAALGRWMNSLWYQSGLNREQIAAKAVVSPSVWDRLVYHGEVPECFGFQSFATTVHADDGVAQENLINALKRSFAAREFVRLLEDEVDVGAPSRDFWDETWKMFINFSAIACSWTQRNISWVGLGRIQTEVAMIVEKAKPVSIWNIHAMAARHDDLWPLWDDYSGFAEGYAREHEIRDAQDLEEAVISAIVPTWQSEESVLNRRLWHAQTFAETEQCLKALIQLCPDNPSHWSQLGTVYRREKNFSEAENAFRMAASLPYSSDANKLTLANFLSERGCRDEARKILDETKDEADPSWVYAMACFAFDGGERQDAIHWLTVSISEGHQLAACHEMLMQLYAKQGDSTAADRHRREAARFRLST